MSEVIKFCDAIGIAKQYNKNHLLLGNGFSISCIPSIFTYRSIFDQADFSKYPELKEIFLELNTTDFEEVIYGLEQSIQIVPYYHEDSNDVIIKMKQHASYIKDLLITTVAQNHPDMPSLITEEQYKSCRNFLSNFISVDKVSNIYTLNYDLLLYWSYMHEMENESIKLYFNDGFVKSYDEETHEQGSELFWEGKTTEQNIHFMHGALHLYQGDGLLEKKTWLNTGVKLVTQARVALENNQFPLFVSEGNSNKKMSKIYHHPYLFNSFKSFEDVVNGGKGTKPGNTCIFSYGLSFSENDTHIFNKIALGRIKHLFVSIFGDKDEPVNKGIFAKCESLISMRNEYPLKVTYYDAMTANVWGN